MNKLMICPRAKGCTKLNCTDANVPHFHGVDRHIKDEIYNCVKDVFCPDCIPYVPEPSCKACGDTGRSNPTLSDPDGTECICKETQGQLVILLPKETILDKLQLPLSILPSSEDILEVIYTSAKPVDINKLAEKILETTLPELYKSSSGARDIFLNNIVQAISEYMERQK